MLRFPALLLGLITVLKLQLGSAIIIELPDGKVEGISDTTREGTTFYGFLALRYAEPPVGELRFKPPQSLKPWNGTYNGTEEKNICYQVNGDNDKENEDCLFANVFTPVDVTNASHASDLAVMVWIHGGGFIGGAGYRTEGGVGPKFFMDAGVVLVSINYRLGPFGFMSSGDGVLPGNLGLKDQAEALRWVQKNIEYFGGDPDKVTIFGQSAGSASVSYQLLNPHVKGLFRAAILESGAALSPWAYQRNETQITFETAQLIDPAFASKNTTELLEFLQSVPAASIDKASLLYTLTSETAADYQISNGFFYAPVIETPNDEAILNRTQYELLESGEYNQVPVLMGMTSEESVGFVVNNDLSTLCDAYDEDPSILVPFDLHLTDADAKKLVGEDIWKYFTDDQGFSADDGAKAIMYHSIQDFDKANIKQAEVISQHSTVYFYQFSYSGLMGTFNFSMPGCGRVAHSEELNYIFSKWLSTDIPDNTDMSYFPESDQKVHYRLMALWTDFAKYLNPTPKGVDEDILQNVTWEEVQPKDFKYLDIGTDLVMTKGYPKEEKYLYWTNLYDKTAIPPLDTF